MITRIISAPRPETMALLLRRVVPDARKELADKHFDAIGIFQTDIPSLFYYTDIGQKAGKVIAVEIVGSCPQHVNSMAFFGSNEGVNAAIGAINAAAKQKDK